MNGNLVYVIGPSGAGKDSVIDWLVSQPGLQESLHWATRDVTREGHDSSRRDRAVSAQTFATLQAQGAYALWWQANGLSYGVRHEALLPLAQGRWMLINGSRRHLPAAMAQYPGLAILYITADAQRLRQRLLQRGREQAHEVQARLAQGTLVDMASDFLTNDRLVQVFNNGSLEEAGRQALAGLSGLPGWPETRTQPSET